MSGYGPDLPWRQVVQGAILAGQLDYWRKQLAGLPPVHDLPTDRPRPAEQSFRGGLVRFAVDRGVTDGLLDVGRRCSATLFMTLHAAFATLLARYSGTDDIVVGAPVANRDQPEVASLIGLFVNTLVLRTDLSGDPTFEDLLRRVRATALAAYAHRDMPFEQLVDALHLTRSLSHTPLFQVVLVMQNTPAGTLRLPGLDVTTHEPEGVVAKFDLTLTLTRDAIEDGGWTMDWEVSLDLFDRATVRRFMDQYRRLLTAAVAEPGRRLGELPLLSPGERQALLYEWNAPRPGGVSGLGLHGLLAARAQAAPDRVAAVDGAVQLSYGELVRRARGVAAVLAGAGVRRGDRVGLRLERGAELGDRGRLLHDRVVRAPPARVVRTRLGVAYIDEGLEFGFTWRRDYDDTGDARRRPRTAEVCHGHPSR